MRFKCLQAGARFGIPHRYNKEGGPTSQNGQKWVAVRGETWRCRPCNREMMEM